MVDAHCTAGVGWDHGRQVECSGRIAGWIRHTGSRLWHPVCILHARQHHFHPPEFRPLREGRPDDAK